MKPRLTSSIAATIVSILAIQTAIASQFQCGKFTQKNRQVEKPNQCDDTPGFGLITQVNHSRPELSKIFKGWTDEMFEKQKDTALRDKALEVKFRTTSNMNAANFKFPSGVTRTVYRGSYLAPQFTKDSILKRGLLESDKNRACMKSLVTESNLQKIVNYDELDWESAKHMTSDEKKEFKSLNQSGKYWEFTPTYNRTFQYKFSKGKGTTLEEKKKDVMGMVASIIHEIEGNPQEPGSVYIHCYGGHHRTGVVYGVMQKCMGKMPVDDIINEYKCHIGYESAENPGGYNNDNETLIREFPCKEHFGSR